MSKKSVVGLCLSLFFHLAIAGNQHKKPSYEVDLFGDSSPQAGKLLKQYQLRLISQVAQEDQLKKSALHPSQKLMSQLQIRHQQLCDEIKRAGHYLYAEFEVIHYPTRRAAYITLEVVRPEDVGRLRWISKMEAGRSLADARDNRSSAARSDAHPHAPNDVVQAMEAYMNLGMHLALTGELVPEPGPCKKNHCLFGFSHPQLTPYRDRFDKGLKEEKSVILKALDDPDPQRRASAALLVGEFQNPEEIFNYLSTHVLDASEEVRNNAIRVMGMTMEHSKYYQIELKPFFDLLNSPHVSDRNKALMILFAATDDPLLKQQIRRQALLQLKALAKLKQPNNGHFAQLVLEKLGVVSHDASPN